MHQDAHARIDELQHAFDVLSSTVQDLTQRVARLEPEAQPETVPEATPEATPDSEQPSSTLSSLVEQKRAASSDTDEHTDVAPTPPVPVTAAATHPPHEDTHRQRDDRAFKPMPSPKRAREFEFDLSKLEWVLGIRGLMLLGVVIVIVGVGMFLKLAHDEGWIAAMSPIAKCGGTCIFGLVLIGIGELLRKRLSPLASSGFTAAGIATVFASVYAASRVYNLFGVELAFALLLVTTLGGILLGAIGQRVMLSLLSLIGAFAVPMLLSAGEPSYFVFPAYLLLLLSMGAVLSAWKGGHYAYARELAWWGTGLLGTAWLVDMHDRSIASSLIFVALAWLMTVVELAISARFFTRLRDRIEPDKAAIAGIQIDAEGNRSLNPAGLLTRESRWINALFGATIWAVISAGVTLRARDPDLVFLSPMGFAAMGAVVAWVAMRAGGVRRISTEAGEASPLSLYLSAVAVNSALLLVATIATGLGGWLEVLAWLCVGAGAVEAGRRLRFRAVGLFGGAMLDFAVVRLFSFDLRNASADAPNLNILGVAVGAWGVQVLAAAIAFGAACWRSRYRPEQLVAGSIAIWLVALCVVNAPSDHGRMGLYWSLLAVGVLWALRASMLGHLRFVLRINALVMLGLGTCIGVASQFTDSGGVISPTEVAVLLGAWLAFALLAGAGYVHRTIGASVAVGLILLALGRIGQDHGADRMLLWQAVAIGCVSLAGARLWRWSLMEIAAVLSMIFACAWGLDELRHWDGLLTRVPMIGYGSITSFNLLTIMLGVGLTIVRIRLAADAIGDVRGFRTALSSTLLCASWLLALIVSTLEIVRLMHQWFDSSSAQGAGVSIWWSVFAVASVAMGFRLARALRWAGLTLLCIVAGKVLLLDTMTLAPTGRIIASITVGLIIIATGVLYTWLVKRLEMAEADAESCETTSADGGA
ncbi:MAG: DUF2339 domain-containing protein [Phycisphaerales bacterium]|nr:DUF2339 domain-containing protein [Phycisphaerales bacterium]